MKTNRNLKTQAVVVERAGDTPRVVEIDLVPLVQDEVRVEVFATGICHTDVAWADGALIDAFPVVLGHESAGVVQEVGPAVSRVKVGDHVVLALAHNCGHCRFCETGRPMLCRARTEARPRLLRGSEPLVQAFGTGSLSQQTIVREASTIPIPRHIPLDLAAVVGCSTSTGLGAVFNIADVEYGATVAILGAGGIGLSVVMGCRIAGAGRIVVADPNDRRREAAISLGATDAVESVEDVLRDLEPTGFEYVFEAAGHPEAMELAVRIAEPGGTVTLIGVPPPGTMIQIDAREFVPSQRRVLGCLTGNVRPNVDFPRYFRLYELGMLDLGALVSDTIEFTDVAKAFDWSRKAHGIRTLVSMTSA